MPPGSSLARRLRLSWAALCALTALWLAGWWRHSPGVAVVGAALLLAMPSLTLGLELCIACRIGQHDSAAPRPSTGQWLRAWLSEVRHFHAAFCWRQPFAWRDVADDLGACDQGRAGVVLVHGYMCNRGFWAPWLRQLRRAGHPCIAVNLEPVHASIDHYAAAIDEAVRRMTQATGRAPILVCHSMGGLAARAWWRASRGAHPVAQLVTIASPHRGTWLGRFSRSANGVQMQLDSDWLRELAADELRQALPPTTCWYSNCDNVVFPPSVATLAGADRRFVPGEAHVALAFHPAVLRGCFALLLREDASRQGELITGIRAENS
jgi:triacylglycerol lipase